MSEANVFQIAIKFAKSSLHPASKPNVLSIAAKFAEFHSTSSC